MLGGRVWSLGGHGPGQQASCRNGDRPYEPSQALRDMVIGLHRTCRFPGCRRRAESCDLDHVIPFAAGGTTCLCNLSPLCRYHHLVKTHAGWAVRFTGPDDPYPAGALEWVSRCGQRQITLPPVLPGSNGWTLPFSAPATIPSTEPGWSGATGNGTYRDLFDEILDPADATPEQRRSIRDDRWNPQPTPPPPAAEVFDSGDPPF